MDWDEPKKTKPEAHIGEDLSQHSADDLKTRIEELKAEIARVENEIAQREGQISDADAIFKR